MMVHCKFWADQTQCHKHELCWTSKNCSEHTIQVVSYGVPKNWFGFPWAKWKKALANHAEPNCENANDNITKLIKGNTYNILRFPEGDHLQGCSISNWFHAFEYCILMKRYAFHFYDKCCNCRLALVMNWNMSVYWTYIFQIYFVVWFLWTSEAIHS